MNQPILSMSMWTSLSNEQRNRIRVLFKIPRSKNTEVNDGHIVTDGTTPEDFKALTIEKMQIYLGEKESTDFHKLFDRVIARVQDEIEGKSIIPSVIIPTPTFEAPIIPKRRGRPSKKNAQI
jgi:hypothetical protein